MKYKYTISNKNTNIFIKFYRKNYTKLEKWVKSILIYTNKKIKPDGSDSSEGGSPAKKLYPLNLDILHNIIEEYAQFLPPDTFDHPFTMYCGKHFYDAVDSITGNNYKILILDPAFYLSHLVLGETAIEDKYRIMHVTNTNSAISIMTLLFIYHHFSAPCIIIRKELFDIIQSENINNLFNFPIFNAYTDV